MSKFLKLVPVCPENAIGLGTPRPPIQLVMLQDAIAVRGVEDRNLDLTRELICCAQQFRREHPEISGFVLKSRSPSCGVESTKLYDAQGELIHEQASGMFAATLSDENNALPVTDEDRLLDSNHRLDFLLRVFAISRLQQLSTAGSVPDQLLQYHRRYLPLLQALSGDYVDWFEQTVLSVCSVEDSTRLVETYQAYVISLLCQYLDRKLLHEVIVNAIELAAGENRNHELQKILQSFRDGTVEWIDIMSDLSRHYQHRLDSKHNPFVLLSEYCPLSLLAD